MSISQSTVSCTGLKKPVESRSAGWLETISETLLDEAGTGPWVAMSTHPTTEPVDFRNGQKIVEWPDGFDPATLPDPHYHDGDRVQFVRDETCTREGTVRLVLLKGGVYGPLER